MSKRAWVLLVIFLGLIWVYTHVDFDAVYNNAVNTIKKEKTINIINQSNQRSADEVQRILNSDY